MCTDCDPNTALAMPNDGDEEKYSTTECVIYYVKVCTKLDSYNLDYFSCEARIRKKGRGE